MVAHLNCASGRGAAVQLLTATGVHLPSQCSAPGIAVCCCQCDAEELWQDISLSCLRRMASDVPVEIN